MGARFHLVAVLATLGLAVAPAAAGEPAAGPRPGLPGELRWRLHDVGRELEEWRALLQGYLGVGPAVTVTGEPALVSFMLARREALELTEAQVATLEGLRRDVERAAIRLDADRRVAEMDLAAVRDAEPVDLGRAEALIREIERLRADLRVAQVRAIEAARRALSPEQRAKLRGLLGEAGAERAPRAGRPPGRM